MSTELTLPAGFGPAPTVFAGDTGGNSELGQGVGSSYAVIGYRGKVWSLKYQGTETQMMRDDGDGPRNSIEVVLVKASPSISKIFYKSGYVDGSNAPPDCWSGNGVTPDASVLNKVNPTCADCPMNAWGSRVTEAGKQSKGCADSRRMAVVPIADIDNETYGGPLLLRVPAASLKDLKAYGDMLDSYSFPYYAAVTRIAFDPKEAFPKFVFSAIRPLTNEEAMKIKELREDKRVATVLAERADAAAPPVAAAGPEVPKSPFENGAMPLSEQAKAAPPAAAQPVAQAAAPRPTAPKPAAPTVQQAAPETVAEEDTPEEEGVLSYDDFDSALENVLGGN